MKLLELHKYERGHKEGRGTSVFDVGKADETGKIFSFEQYVALEDHYINLLKDILKAGNKAQILQFAKNDNLPPTAAGMGWKGIDPSATQDWEEEVYLEDPELENWGRLALRQCIISVINIKPVGEIFIPENMYLFVRAKDSYAEKIHQLAEKYDFHIRDVSDRL